MGWDWLGNVRSAAIATALLSNATFAACDVKTPKQIRAGLHALENTALHFLTTTNLDGIGIAIAQGGRLLFSKNYGDGVTNPIFQAASIGKVVSAFGAMKLVERGKLTLDEPLSKFVSAPYLPPGPFADKVTLRTVLNHTSGMTNDPDGVDRSIAFEPGTQYSYSGAGFHYMQTAVEDTTGRDFNSYMVGELKKLGMKNSHFELEDAGAVYVGAAYSLMTTPEELLHFFDELGSPDPANAWVAEKMTLPTWQFDPDESVGLGPRLSFCGAEVSIHHTGCNFSRHRGIAIHFKKSRTTVVVLARGKDSYGVPSRLAELAVGGF